MNDRIVHAFSTRVPVPAPHGLVERLRRAFELQGPESEPPQAGRRVVKVNIHYLDSGELPGVLCALDGALGLHSPAVRAKRVPTLPGDTRVQVEAILAHDHGPPRGRVRAERVE